MLLIAVPLLAVVVVAGVVAMRLLSGPDLAPGETASDIPYGTPVSSAQGLLTIAEATGADNCRISDVPAQLALYTVYCQPAGERMYNVNFIAYADADTFARTAPTSGVYGVPGEDEDCALGHSFTGTWEQGGRGGTMACVMGPGAYTLVWTENTRLIQVGFNVVDPDLEATDDQVDAAVSWWEDNATLD
jgi:hypothetical protein